MVQTRRSVGPVPKRPNNSRRLSVGEADFQSIYPDLRSDFSTTSKTTKNDKSFSSSDKSDDEECIEESRDTTCDSSFSQTSSRSAFDFHQFSLPVIISIVFVAVLVILFISSKSDQKNSDVSSMYKFYINNAKLLIKNDFPGLSKDNRQLLKHVGQKIFENSVGSPIVVAIGGEDADKFAQGIEESIFKAQGKSYSSDRVIQITENNYRADFHENLRKSLETQQKNGSTVRTITILHIDFLKWDSVLALHAFSDHQNYPIPRTVLLLTVSSDFRPLNAKSSCDEDMVNFLSNRWIKNGGSSDNIPPIVSRIRYFLCI